MKLSDISYLLDEYGDNELAITVVRVGTVGSTPTVGVRHLSAGFDWDRGRIIIVPEEPLRQISMDEIKTIKQKYDELGWSYYKTNRIKKENERLKEENAELKSKLESLKNEK